MSSRFLGRKKGTGKVKFHSNLKFLLSNSSPCCCCWHGILARYPKRYGCALRGIFHFNFFRCLEAFEPCSGNMPMVAEVHSITKTKQSWSSLDMGRHKDPSFFWGWLLKKGHRALADSWGAEPASRPVSERFPPNVDTNSCVSVSPHVCAGHCSSAWTESRLAWKAV